MSAVMESPMRPFPGTYLDTPVPSRTGAALGAQRRGGLGQQTSALARPLGQERQEPAAPQQQQGGQVVSAGNSGPAELSPVERGARTINETLVKEAQYPELDTYVGRKWMNSAPRSLY